MRREKTVPMNRKDGRQSIRNPMETADWQDSTPRSKNTNRLMLSSDLVTSEVLNHFLRNIAERNHAHGLPHTQTDTRHHTAVQALDTGLAVDVLEGVADGHLLGPIGVVFLALHLHAHDFDRLVPGGETAAEGGREDLFGHAKLDRGIFLVGDFADTGLAVAVVLVKMLSLP